MRGMVLDAADWVRRRIPIREDKDMRELYSDIGHS